MTKKTPKSCEANEVETLNEDMNGAVETTEKQKLPQFVQKEDGEHQIEISTLEQLQDLFGTKSEEFCTALLSHCGNVSGMSDALGNDKNYALAIVAEIAPTDGLEAMLATQMAATHIAMMRQSRFMAGSDTISQLDVNERVYNKLARTFTTQMEALRKHRHGGQQTVTVQHVTVSEGGQAIVGNVKSDGGLS